MAGAGAGFCMAKKAKIDFTSVSYEASAIVLPLAANRHAAIHLAYCPSFQIKYLKKKMNRNEIEKLI